MQTAIPCLFMRGGTSRGPFFLESDLPDDPALRDRVLLAAMGSPDARQIDGLGGADPLTSKVGIVSRSARPGVDLEFLFAQVLIDEARVDTTPNCGNMLAAVGPFALERGLVAAARRRDHGADPDAQHRHAVRRRAADARTGAITYEGAARIDGVPGTSAPIKINFLDTAGSVCGKLLPTGPRRRHLRRRSGHLHRQRHAGGRDPCRGPRPHRLRVARRAQRRSPSSRRGSNRSGCRRGRR